jgi:ribosomal protein S18 acetylase RimI-like enzyme
MKILRATRRHVAPMAELMAASPLLRRYGVTRAGAAASLEEALRARELVLIAADAGTVVGLAWVIRTSALDRSAYLRLLLIGAGAQSRGLGAALLVRAERDARASGSRHLVLLVTRTNRRARSFYERHGYTRVGDIPGFVRPGIAESLYVKSWGRPAARTAADARTAGSATRSVSAAR